METETLTHRREPHAAFDALEIVREELLRRFLRVRATTDWICEPLTVEDCVVQTSTDCSPVKWQLAHTTWFFETFVLAPHARGYRLFHPQFGYLFNSYYNAIGERTPRDLRGLMSRPTLAEVLSYRAHVHRAVERFILDSDSDVLRQLAPIIVLGINHEQQHQELMITDVKTVLAMNPLRPIYRAREIISTTILPLNWISFDEGLIEIGAHGNDFYFDNEGPRHRQYSERFALADRLITNAEYKDFIADGGYKNPALWLSDGWAKCQSDEWQAPKYWELNNGAWWAMTLQGFREIEDSEPVTHISYYEADAYATWRDARLPTEFEWELTANDISIIGTFLDDGNFHPVANVAQTSVRDPAAGSQTKVCATSATQMFGNAWQWTRSAYLPYPGYKVTEGALGEYNGKFMSNQMVLRGGSCVTPQDHIRATYRNFFPPESRWQFSGIRLAK
jgi:ergothioneine biosynthesis protein EgtB